MNSPHTMKLYSVYETNTNIYLILELISGGELLSYTQKLTNFGNHDI